MYCMSICACSDKGNDCRNRVKVTPKAFWSKHMIAVNGAVNLMTLWVLSTNGPPARIKKRGQKSKPSYQYSGNSTRQKQHVGSKKAFFISPDEPNKCLYYNQRSRCCFSQSKVIYHLSWCCPAINIYSPLIYVSAITLNQSFQV